MKFKLPIFFALVFAVSGAVFGQTTDAAKLPTAQEILAKYTAALGGREANEKIKTRVMRGTVELSPMGIKGDMEVLGVAPNKNYTKINLAGVGEIVQGFDGTTAWMVNPLQGNRDRTGQELEQVKLASNLHREVNLDKLYPEMKVTGTEKIGDRNAYVVSATPAGLPAEIFYFDTETGLLLRSDSTLVAPEGNQNVKVFYEDVRTVDGVKIPFKVRTVTPQFEIITTVTEVKHGEAIDAAKFAKPAQ